MAAPRMRPRFALETECGVEDVMQALEGKLADCERAIEGRISSPHCVLVFPEEKRRFWTPQLSITVDEKPEGARIQCIFSPQPQIWTAFVFTYLTLFMLGLSGLMYGIAELSLGRTPWAMLAPVATSILAGFVYGATFIGQGLGAQEMCHLRDFLYDCLEAASAKHQAEPRTAQDSAQL
jgi:hypothetical protein